MSLYIDTATVTRVLLADGWHDVEAKSFTLDAYEYLEDEELLHGGGQDGICASGFNFTTPGVLGDTTLTGPLTSILAVQRDT